MLNLNRSNFQAHPFHLVSPSPWPLYTSISLLSLTTSAALSFHGFAFAQYNLMVSLLSLILAMAFWWRDVIAEGTYIGHHTLAVQRGLNLGVALFIVSEALFFLAIFWAFFHKLSTLWIGAKLRGNPKALITKLYRETYKVAPLIPGGTVTLLEILDTNQGMGNRGSKSDSLISVKEQRVDGSSVFFKYCKVYSKCQRNLVFMQLIKYGTTLFESIQKFYTTISYSNSQIYLFSILWGWSLTIFFVLLKSETNIGKTNQIITTARPRAQSFSGTSEAMSSNFNYASTNALHPYYVTGFADGKGCFYIGVTSNPRYKTDYRVKAVFHIGVHIRNLALLEQIQLFFGVGTIAKLGAEYVQFRVSGFENLKVIRNHFDTYPLLTNKQFDYLLFKQVVNDMEQGKHLTVEGSKKIMSIKAVMDNKGMSDNVNLIFPNIDPIVRPAIKHRKIKSLHWLAGFTDAVGCFFIGLKKHPASTLGETVWLRFILIQHSKQEEFLKSLFSTLNCGRYIAKSGYGEFIVEKFTDVFDKVIPIFEDFKLHGVKSKNYDDFKKAALLIKNKQHLTREGLDYIKKIKGSMNKNRE